VDMRSSRRNIFRPMHAMSVRPDILHPSLLLRRSDPMRRREFIGGGAAIHRRRNRINRRDVMGALLALAGMAVPLRAKAQATKGEKPKRIVTFPDFSPPIRDAFLDAMRELGWAESRDFIIVQSGFQWGVMSGIDEALGRLVADTPDLIFVGNDAHGLAAQRATVSIPIVLSISGYPVENGLAESLARPGKNVTGISAYAGVEIWSKLLQMLREAKPDIKRVSTLWTYVPPLFPPSEPAVAELRNAARVLGLQLHIAEAAGPDLVPGALAEIEAERPDALLLTSGNLAVKVRPAVMQFAVNNRLATIADAVWVIKVEPYPLLTYGTRQTDLTRNAVYYVDKILKGAKPGELPIQQPRKLELKVSLKTAKAIGLTVPPSLLARADEVIE
jgi:putative ABC transport system substrate-binding protein